MATFENERPEDSLPLFKNFRIAIDRTGTKDISGRNNYIHMIIHGEELREFNEFVSHNNGTENTHLKQIQEGLLG